MTRKPGNDGAGARCEKWSFQHGGGGATGISKNRGFTLIELLMCLGVIATLAALTAVAVTHAKVKAKQVRCLGNLRQHGIALAAFLGEQNVYPLYINPGQRFPDHGVSLWDALSSHGLGPIPSDTRDPNGVYHCPSFIEQLMGDNRLDILVALYGYNAEGLNGGGNTNLPSGLGLNWNPENQSYYPVNESLVVAPSRMLAMGDGVMGWNNTYQDSANLSRQPSAQDHIGSTSRVTRRHDGRLNVLFCDGHAIQESLQFLFSDTSDAALSSWNRDNQPHAERIK
jgi:prepilin-type N-terminal cleavage/methylation domain-containing protein/prepilin-type processing-associated H-X9-DG protein